APPESEEQVQVRNRLEAVTKPFDAIKSQLSDDARKAIREQIAEIQAAIRANTLDDARQDLVALENSIKAEIKGLQAQLARNQASDDKAGAAIDEAIKQDDGLESEFLKMQANVSNIEGTLQRLGEQLTFLNNNAPKTNQKKAVEKHNRDKAEVATKIRDKNEE